MKRLLLVSCFTVFVLYMVCQNYMAEKNTIDSQISKLIENGKFVEASNRLVDFAIQLEESGDTLSALQYQLENCNLIDNHIDYFRKSGLTSEGYFANWYVTISLEGWTKKKEDGAHHLFSLLRKMQKEAPELIPFYASTLAYVIEDCKEPNYNDSIYLLQPALDVIKTKPPTPELVKQFIDISSCFNANRFYNSYNGTLLVKNRLQEINDWYLKNSSYIHNLKIEEYGDEIIEYELDYINTLHSFAGTIGAQENNPIRAIKIYEEEIEILKSLPKYGGKKVAQKIAACYANISKNYYQLGEKGRSKEYSDKSIEFLFDHEDDFEYCDILSAIALNLFNVGNYSIAAQMKLTEILTREKLGWQCFQSDWALYFMYSKINNPQNILNVKDQVLSAETRDGGASLFEEIGDAYSILMDDKNGYKDSAEIYFNKVDSILNANKESYGKEYTFDSRRASLMESWAGHYMRLNEIHKSYDYSVEALQLKQNSTYINYCNVSLKAALLHDIEGIHKYLPQYYYGLENDLGKMLPTLGSVESDAYLGNGYGNLYYIPEWASWNPYDTVSVSIAYDAALLMKGLTLRYNTLAPYISDNPSLITAKQELERRRDSIYTIVNDDQRILELYKYEQAERDILKDINEKMVNIHWQDVKKHLKEDEACVEFIKYTINAYSWSKVIPKPHYAALILSGNGDYPIFVDLFDEDELNDAYILQPKSYDSEVGIELYDNLWGKLKKHIIGKSRVYFSPMGILNLINIEALADCNGQTALETYNLKRVSSTRQIISSINNEPIRSIVSYGGIDYAEMSEAIVDSLNTRGNWSYLKNTLTEVQSVENSLHNRDIKVTTITGTNATETSFKKLDGTTANVIHVASHGFYVPQQRRDAIPYYAKSDYTKNLIDELFYSGLVMSGGQTAWTESTFEAEKDDGILTSYEISKLDLHNVDLVVLSACETGLGDNLFDGIFGLQRAFKKAGAQSILMSLWSINDKVTSEYMEHFYGFLSSGLSKHEAYRRTIAEMKKKYDDPYYWASFIMLD